MYRLTIKNKTTLNIPVRIDIETRTIQEAVQKLNDIRNQDRKDNFVRSFCLFELNPIAKTEEELQRLLKKEEKCLMKNKKRL